MTRNTGVEWMRGEKHARGHHAAGTLGYILSRAADVLCRDGDRCKAVQSDFDADAQPRLIGSAA